MKKLYLLDAHALCYRAFYAVKGLTNSKGQPTNAVYGFVNILRKMLKDFDPEYFAVCFDRDGKTFRQEMYKEYKIQRPPMPDDLKSQMALIHDVVEAYGLPVMEVSGYEADDLMATAAEMFSKDKVELVIITDDKDLFQLVGDKVSVFSPRRDKILKIDDVHDVLGIFPKYVSDFLGMAGDSSDNIPGVQGVGKVTAQKLIGQFGSLEDIYQSIDEIKSKSVREKMLAQKEQAFMSRELAILRKDAPLDLDLEHWHVKEASSEKLYELFTELEFHRFAAELKPAEQAALDVKPLKEVSFDVLLPMIKKKKQYAFLSDEETQKIFFTDGVNTASLSWTEVKKQAADIFVADDIVKISYDWKRQYKIFWTLGLLVSSVNVFDVMLAGYLLDPIRNGHELGVMLWKHLKQMRPDDADGLYDVAASFRLYKELKDALEKSNVLKLLTDMEIPLAKVLAKMEVTGVRLDIDLLKKLSKKCGKKIDILKKDIYEIAGEEFNINSPKQLSHVLFEKLELPVIKKTKTGFSTNEEVLTRLSWQHELPKKILDYRQLAKLKSTYIDALPELAQASGTDMIHTSFNQTVTETGRLSSSNPNLQNIPIRTDLGRQIRGAFIPLEDGHLLLSADYSQIELRILAHLSGDKNLIKAFKDGEDIHTFTAAQMFEVELDKVDEDMRTSAKRVNFGIIYGISSFGLAKDLHVSFSEAQDFIDRYFLRYPKVKEFMDQAIEDCRTKGYAVTLMNRRRDIPEITSRNRNIQQFAERQAINMPVQGTAADLIKLAMVKVDKRMQEEQLASKMLITVHDEIVFDVIPKEEKVLIDMVRQEMEAAMDLVVPIDVSIKKGKSWLNMEKVL